MVGQKQPHILLFQGVQDRHQSQKGPGELKVEPREQQRDRKDAHLRGVPGEEQRGLRGEARIDLHEPEVERDHGGLDANRRQEEDSAGCQAPPQLDRAGGGVVQADADEQAHRSDHVKHEIAQG